MTTLGGNKPPSTDRARAFLHDQQKEGKFPGRGYQNIQDKVKTMLARDWTIVLVLVHCLVSVHCFVYYHV